MLEGRCHCGAVTVALESALPPGQLPVRVCGCGFCARHRPIYTTDPAGQLTVYAADEEALLRYRFGLRLADFLMCRVCGVFVAALDPQPPARAVLNLVVLDHAAEFTGPTTRFTDYDREDITTRRARRARTWTPAALRWLA
jgi:hypothetical protein